MFAPISDKKAFVSELHSRLREHLDATKETDKAFCARIGSSNALFKNLAAGSLPSADRLEVLLNELNLSIRLGAKAVETISPPEIAVTEIDGELFAPVRRIEAELAAGGGIENGDGAGVSETLAFRRDWLQRLGVSASSACLVKVRGESMQPTLHDGDLVLIDQARRKVRSGRVYAFTEDGQARVKRLDCIDDHTLVIRSDNPSFPLEIRKAAEADNLRIFGEVVWAGHTFT